MKIRTLSFLALLVIANCAATSRADDVDTVIQEQMKQHKIAGLSLKVISHGKAIKTQGYGMANLEWNIPVASDTVFEIGSMTKQFTAACILLLQQDGRLSVDDLISKHLKNTPESWSHITIRHLLTHTSGITNYTGLNGFELTRHLTQAQFVEKIGSYPLAFQPGDAWSYCNSGYNLLGFIVENESGKNYWDFLHERILDPLGMKATTSRNPGIIVAHRADGYELSHGRHINRDYDLTDIFSAGAIISTVEDLEKWNAALDGDTLLNKESKELWWTPAKLNSGKIKEYGFGWSLDPLDGHRNIGHGGATSGFSATIQRYPDDGLAIIILTNADETGLASSTAKKIAPLYFATK